MSSLEIFVGAGGPNTIAVLAIRPGRTDIGGTGGVPLEMAGWRARYDGGFCHRARHPAGYGGVVPPGDYSAASASLRVFEGRMTAAAFSASRR